jgi:DNA-binding response OmpR family regulator
LLGDYRGSFRQGLIKADAGFMAQKFHFGEFTLDESSYRLQRGDRRLRLEKVPMELLILLVQRHGQLISREEMAGHIWITASTPLSAKFARHCTMTLRSPASLKR